MATINGTEGHDTLQGTAEADVIRGLGGNDTIRGGDGADDIEGGAGNDGIEGQGGDDVIRGGDGDDVLNGGDGNDQLYGGAGVDFFHGGTGNDTASGDAGADVFVLSNAASGVFDGGDERDAIWVNDLGGAGVTIDLALSSAQETGRGLFTFLNIEDLKGTGAADHLYGTEAANVIDGAGGADVMEGRGGDDTLVLRDASTAYGGAGADTIQWQGAGGATLHGDEGADTITATVVATAGLGPAPGVFGGAGNDRITLVATSTASPNDPSRRVTVAAALDAGDGNDWITLREAAFGPELLATVTLGAGADVIEAGTYDYAIQAGAVAAAVINDFSLAEDQVNLAAFEDHHGWPVGSFRRAQRGPDAVLQFSLDGATWMDVFVFKNTEAALLGPQHSYDGRSLGPLWIIGGPDADTLNGTDGADRIDGQGGDDHIEGLAGDDFVLGGAGSDVVNAGGGVDEVRGGDGDDLVDGGAGDDRLDGGAGADNLFGGTGVDTLLGGADADFLRGGADSDTLDGGAGLDIAAYEGLRRAYDTTGLDSVSGGPEGGEDELTSVETLDFLDGLLTTDTNSAAAQLYRLYDTALGRAPDPWGFNAWLGQHAAGVSLLEIAIAFTASPEFTTQYAHLANRAFVEAMYRNTLDREGEPSGVDSWTRFLDNGGSRVDVVRGFSESDEHRSLMSGAVAAGVWVQDATAAKIARLYDAALDRLPDAPGVSSWMHQAEHGMTVGDIAAAFVGSEEFQSRYGGLDDRSFVEALYRNALNREGEESGIDAWTSLLDQGASRATVLLGFSESLEHSLLVSTYVDSGLWFI